MSTVASYIGRTIDIAAWSGQVIGQDALVTPALAAPGNSGEVCTGIVKLVQRWQIEFLTIAGTMQFLPQRGCEFMALLQAGQIRTVLDAEQAFYVSASQVKLNLTAEDSTSDPPDEQLASAVLLSLDITGDTLAISVQLTSQAGSARTVILPITTTITGSQV